MTTNTRSKSVRILTNLFEACRQGIARINYTGAEITSKDSKNIIRLTSFGEDIVRNILK